MDMEDELGDALPLFLGEKKDNKVVDPLVKEDASVVL